MGIASIFLMALLWLDQRWETTPLIVTGRAVDAEGKPVAALKIELADFEPGEQWIDRLSVTTGEDGRFRLGPLDRIGYTTIVSGVLPDGKILLWSRTIRTRESGIDDVGDLLVERVEPWVKGRVVDEKGNPIVGAEVVAFNHANRVFAKSDASGRFSLGGIFDKDVRVDARTDKLQANQLVVPIMNEREIDLVLASPRDFSPPAKPTTRRPPPDPPRPAELLSAMKSAFSLSAHVLDADGNAVEDAVVGIAWSSEPVTGSSGPRWEVGRDTTDAAGIARFSDLPFGNACIGVWKGRRPPLFQNILLDRSWDMPIELHLERGAFIEGFVVEDGVRRSKFDGYRRAAHVEIGSSSLLGAEWYFLEYDGSFRAGPLPSGLYSILYYDEKPVRQIDVCADGHALATHDSNFSPFLKLTDGETAKVELRIVK